MGDKGQVLSAPTTTLTGGTTGDWFGGSVSGAGDVNADGYDDVIIGALLYDGGSHSWVGAAYIHHGSSSGVSSRASGTLTGGAAGDSFGSAVSGAGDVNGDGYDDVIIGAPGYDSGSLTDAGAATIHHGPSSGVSSSASRRLTGGSGGFGWSVSGAGAANGDGYDGVIFGEPWSHPRGRRRPSLRHRAGYFPPTRLLGVPGVTRLGGLHLRHDGARGQV